MLRNILCKLMGFYQLLKFDNSVALILSRIFFRKYGVNIYRMKGMEIIIDHAGGDGNGTRAVLVTDMYRKYLRKISREKPINVLDLGANGGGFVLLLKVMGFRLKKVVALEMNPYTYSRLQFNILHNVHDNSILLNELVCARTSTYSINLGRGSTGDSLYSSKGNGTRTEIKGRTMDEIYEKYFPSETINLCKIDVEGAEFEMFEKLPNALNSIEYIIIEIHGSQKQNTFLLKKLQKNNFILINRHCTSDSVFFLKNKNINLTTILNEEA